MFVQVKRLSAVGGSSAKEVAKRMMSLMFTNILARQYNWVGKGNKQALKPLRITAAIKGNYLTLSAQGPSLYVRI